MTNAQAALLAAASQTKTAQDRLGYTSVNAVTLELAESFKTWLDQQDARIRVNERAF